MNVKYILWAETKRFLPLLLRLRSLSLSRSHNINIIFNSATMQIRSIELVRNRPVPMLSVLLNFAIYHHISHITFIYSNNNFVHPWETEEQCTHLRCMYAFAYAFCCYMHYTVFFLRRFETCSLILSIVLTGENSFVFSPLLTYEEKTISSFNIIYGSRSIRSWSITHKQNEREINYCGTIYSCVQYWNFIEISASPEQRIRFHFVIAKLMCMHIELIAWDWS